MSDDSAKNSPKVPEDEAEWEESVSPVFRPRHLARLGDHVVVSPSDVRTGYVLICSTSDELMSPEETDETGVFEGDEASEGASSGSAAEQGAAAAPDTVEQAEGRLARILALIEEAKNLFYALQLLGEEAKELLSAPPKP